MRGIVRLPTDFDEMDRARYNRAVSIWASGDLDSAIKICCQTKDMDSLCQFPYIQTLADIFFREDIPKIKVTPK